MREELVISDASPLIALIDIGELEILRKLDYHVSITDVVKSEVHAQLPAWIEISTGYDRKQFQILRLELDPGEASVIALALEKPGCRIILDESKGRSVAKRLGLTVIGTLGIIIKAKERGLVKSVKEILIKLDEHGFWLSEHLKLEILKRMGE